MRALILLVLLLPGSAAGEPRPFEAEIERLEARQRELQAKLDERLSLLSKAHAAKPTPENAEAARLLRKSAADTRASLALTASSLRKLRAFGSTLTQLKRKPRAVFGAGAVTGEVTLVTEKGSRPLKTDTVILEPGIIFTGEGSADILLADGTRMVLGPNTRLDTRSWSLSDGELYFEHLRAWVKSWSSKFEVRTHGGTASVRGTKFKLTPAALTLFDGEVELSTDAVSARTEFSGKPPEPGAVVETGPEETLMLSLPGGVGAALEPGSRLETSKSGRAVLLRRGSARFSVHGASEPAQVLVPNGRSSASEADWSLRVLASGAAELSVQAGAVMMTADEKRLDEAAMERWWDAAYEEPNP